MKMSAKVSVFKSLVLLGFKPHKAGHSFAMITSKITSRILLNSVLSNF